MDCLRDEFLSGAALSCYKYRCMDVRHAVDQIVYLLHRRTVTDHTVAAVTHFFESLLHIVQLAPEQAILMGAAQQHLEIANGRRLATVAVGARLHQIDSSRSHAIVHHSYHWNAGRYDSVAGFQPLLKPILF